MTDRVVLAYSGGLDTSVGIGWIAEETGAEVIAVAVDVGQGGEDLEQIRQRALACGAVEAVVADARDEFAERLLPARPAGQRALHGPLPAGLRAVPAADRQAPGGRGEAVRRHDRGARLHRQGQRPGPVRGRHPALAPDLRCLAPVRDFAWTREKAIQYAEEHDLPIETSKRSPYSIDQNVWGRAVETGFLEDIWNAPIEDVYAYTRNPATPREPDEVVDRASSTGVPVAIDGHPGHDAAGDPGAERAGRRAGRRPARHGRGPAGRHQEPRGVRGTRARSRCSPRTRSWRTSPSSATSPGSSARSTSAGPSWSTTGCGSPR